MSEPTSQSRLIGRLLLGAAALALPLTASITYAAQDAPAPPAPPEAPAAPEAPVIKKSTKVMIIDNPAGSTLDDKSLHTRVIGKDGKTIVLKTKEPLSEEEAEKHIAKAEASMAEAHVFAMSGDHAGKASGEHKVQKMVFVSTGDVKGEGDTKTGKREVRTFVMSHNGDGKAMAWTGEHGMAMSSCSDGKPIEARTESNVDGERKTSRVMICSKGGDKAQALAGLKKARDKVANDSSLSGEIKSEVLKQLDAEIAKLS